MPNIEELFELFILDKQAEGLANKTINTYNMQFRSCKRHLDTTKNIDFVTKEDYRDMIINMRKSSLARNTISSYTRLMHNFTGWCLREDYSKVVCPIFKGEEVVKATYTHEDCKKLLKKPNPNKCCYGEYRTWVIINVLLNCGPRAGSIREMLIEDVDLKNELLTFRHTKQGRVQVVPMCKQLVRVMKEYVMLRKGEPTDFLFVEKNGNKMSEDSLKLSVKRYNKKRGVKLTSIHAFRHTFAREYILAGGDGLKLKNILGHSTLAMTNHYVNLYGIDLKSDFDKLSPLAVISDHKKTMSFRQ